MVDQIKMIILSYNIIPLGWDFSVCSQYVLGCTCITIVYISAGDTTTIMAMIHMHAITSSILQFLLCGFDGVPIVNVEITRYIAIIIKCYQNFTVGLKWLSCCQSTTSARYDATTSNMNLLIMWYIKDEYNMVMWSL